MLMGQVMNRVRDWSIGVPPDGGMRAETEVRKVPERNRNFSGATTARY
jgi:hypothetical protein